jgi:hypothetical protein
VERRAELPICDIPRPGSVWRVLLEGNLPQLRHRSAVSQPGFPLESLRNLDTQTLWEKRYLERHENHAEVA